MAPRFDKLPFMQAGALFPPAVLFGDYFYLIDQFPFYPTRRSIPLDISHSVLEVNGAGAAI